MKKICFILPLLLFLIIVAHTQDTLTLVNGKKVACKILNEDSSRIFFKIKRDHNDITTFLNKKEIKSVYEGVDIPLVYYDRNAIFKIDLIIPSFELEARLDNSTNILLAYEPGFAFFKFNNDPTEVMIVHQIKTSFRYYYNITDRIQKKRNTYKFSGNFISAYALVTFRSSISNDFVTIGPTWGIQRAWGNELHFSFELGIGSIFSDTYVNFGPLGEIKFGISL